MDFYLCIGSILVFIGICTLTYFIGICTLTYFYYQQAEELRQAKRKIRRLEKYMHDTFSWELATEDDVSDLKFGDF